MLNFLGTLPTVTFTQALDTSDLATKTAALAGAALVLAFGVTGGIVIAKKLWGWLRRAI